MVHNPAHGHILEAHKGQLLDLLLDVVGIVVLAVDEDHILVPAGHGEPGVHQEPQIAGAQPPVAEELVAVGLPPVVSAGDVRSADLDMPDHALREQFVLLVHDADFHPWAGIALVDELDHAATLDTDPCPVLAREGLAVEQAVDRVASHRRGAHHERRLGHAVDREHGLRVESVLTEAVDEQPDRRGRDGLGPVEEHLHTGEVHLGEDLVLDHVEHPEQTEVGARNLGDPVLVDEQDVQRRVHHKGGGGHLELQHARRQGGEVEADESHIMRIGQPAAGTDVQLPWRGRGAEDLFYQLPFLGGSRGPDDGGDVAHQILVGEDHPLGVPGGSRGELQVADIIRGGRMVEGAFDMPEEIADGKDLLHRDSLVEFGRLVGDEEGLLEELADIGHLFGALGDGEAVGQRQRYRYDATQHRAPKGGDEEAVIVHLEHELVAGLQPRIPQCPQHTSGIM